MLDIKKIRDWYHTGAGSLVAAPIEQSLWEVTSCVFGYVAVEIGHVFEGYDLLKNCTIQQKVLIDHSDLANIHASPTALPIE
ncbi:MAG: hypothetical protein AAGH46_09425, partial [Bacteroidota bacterium]